MAATPKEVKKAISKDLKTRKLTHEAAARKLDMGKQSFSNLLYKDQYFSRTMAVRFHNSFGYALPFLISGEGFLIKGVTPEEEYARRIEELNSVIAQKDVEIAELKQVIIEQAKMITAKELVTVVVQNPKTNDAQ